MDTIIIAQAIFVVNKHAKAAPDPKQLYTLKRAAISKLIEEDKAKKVGIHFSNNPKYAQQHSNVVVKCEDYYFHVPLKKEDIQILPHLGHLTNYRNPKTSMSLKRAKEVLKEYTGLSFDSTANIPHRSYLPNKDSYYEQYLKQKVFK